jgi:hypothetical protein
VQGDTTAKKSSSAKDRNDTAGVIDHWATVLHR